MVIRFFIEARKKRKAIRLLESALADADKYIESKELWNISPYYWKNDKIHIAEMFIVLKPYSFQNFIAVFSNTWHEFRNPVVDEFLALKYDDNCNYVKEGFVLINIHL